MNYPSERFSGIARLYGAAALERLRAASVCVIGVGGVGSWAAEALVRSGVGRLTLIDFDDICLTNTNRQLHALDGCYGQAKVAAMAERLQRINPALVVTTVQDFVTPTTLHYLDGGFDFVLDACDTLAAKCALLNHCRRHKIPVITAGAAGGRVDPTAIQVRDLSKTERDPLLASVRKKLRGEYGFPTNPKRSFGIPAVFSLEQPRYSQPDGSVSCQRPKVEAGATPFRLDCGGGYGASTCVTATFGFAAVARILDRLTVAAPRPTASAPSLL